jgi:hypothetical protein
MKPCFDRRAADTRWSNIATCDRHGECSLWAVTTATAKAKARIATRVMPSLTVARQLFAGKRWKGAPADDATTVHIQYDSQQPAFAGPDATYVTELLTAGEACLTERHFGFGHQQKNPDPAGWARC